MIFDFSQTVNLTHGLSFGHNLCFKSPNGLCEPILNIYVPKDFQQYKKLFNPMGFDPCNCSLKIEKSIRILIPKVGIHLGVCGSFLHTLPDSWDHEMWLSASLLARTFASSCLGCEPKVGVTIGWVVIELVWWQNKGYIFWITLW